MTTTYKEGTSVSAALAERGGELPVLGYLPQDVDLFSAETIRHVCRPAFVVQSGGSLKLAYCDASSLSSASDNAIPVVGYVPPCNPSALGDPEFRKAHGINHAYYTGSMANGIASVDIVKAMGRNGMLGFFGAAGLSAQDVEKAIGELEGISAPYGFNLIHSPNESQLESEIVDLYIRRGIHLIEAAAFLRLTLPLIRYRVAGIHRDDDGNIVTPNNIIAKVSRVELATRFFSPPPEKLLAKLLESGDITQEQAQLASKIPVAQDLTAEADSGGHTDNRPAIALLPTMIALRDKLQKQFGYTQKLRVGLAGGISTPESAAAAFAMGAAYIVTGSVNQACVESGSSDIVRKMLAETQQADIIMAPAADMFEMGVEVQVLKRGTMFSMRGTKLYSLYKTYESLDEIPDAERTKLEKTLFLAPLETIWEQTRDFFTKRDPRQIERAEEDPKHKMALVFRWYLGQASRWANAGVPERKMDYQIWCGPSMGAFNEWVKGTFLEAPENRNVATVAKNILYGAAVITRLNSLRIQGFPLKAEDSNLQPLRLEELEEFLD